MQIFRFELDVLIESTASTTKSLKELLENIENNTIKQDGPFQMEDYLTGIIPVNLTGIIPVNYNFQMA